MAPLVLLEAETQGGCKWLCCGRAGGFSEEIQGARAEELKDTCNLARRSPVIAMQAGWGEFGLCLVSHSAYPP